MNGYRRICFEEDIKHERGDALAVESRPLASRQDVQ